MKKFMISIHWLTVILIAIAFLSIEYRSAFGKHTLFHDVMKSSHLYIGFLVLFLTLLRLIAIHFMKKKSLNIPKKKPKISISRFLHLFLYVWLVAIPILGWCILSARGGYSIPFGLPDIINVMPRANVIAIKDLHNTLSYLGLWIIFIHAFLAIGKYYFIKKQKPKES